jgi:hypothetical protein
MRKWVGAFSVFFGALVVVLIASSEARADGNSKCCKYSKDCQGCQPTLGGHVDVGYNSWHRCKDSKSEDFCTEVIAAPVNGVWPQSGPGVCYYAQSTEIYTGGACNGDTIMGEACVLHPYCSWNDEFSDPDLIATKCPLEA